MTDVRAMLADVVTTPLRKQLAELVELIAGPGADDAAVTATVARVRTEVPGPFEAWPDAARGGSGAAEFRRRYPDMAGAAAPAEQMVAERMERDRHQVAAMFEKVRAERLKSQGVAVRASGEAGRREYERRYGAAK